MEFHLTSFERSQRLNSINFNSSLEALKLEKLNLEQKRKDLLVKIARIEDQINQDGSGFIPYTKSLDYLLQNLKKLKVQIQTQKEEQNSIIFSENAHQYKRISQEILDLTKEDEIFQENEAQTNYQLEAILKQIQDLQELDTNSNRSQHQIKLDKYQERMNNLIQENGSLDFLIRELENNIVISENQSSSLKEKLEKKIDEG